MKIKCQANQLARLYSVIAQFGKIVRLDVGDVVTLTAADGGIGARVRSNDFTILEPGVVNLSPLLKKILAEIDGEVELSTDGDKLKIVSDRCKYALDRPIGKQLDFYAIDPVFTMAAKDFSNLIRRTTFATDLDNTHYDLKCVKITFEAGRAFGVATDGRRLAYQTIDCDGEGTVDALFPARSLNIIDRVIATGSDTLQFAMGDLAYLKIGDFEINTAVNSGRFPDWQSIMPNKSGCRRIDFDASELARAVRQAEIVSTQNRPGVDFHFTSNSVNIHAAGESTGESSVDLPIAYDGEEKRLRLDPRFLNDFLKNVAGDVAFYFGGDYRTLLEADGYQNVIMQMT